MCQIQERYDEKTTKRFRCARLAVPRSLGGLVLEQLRCSPRSFLGNVPTKHSDYRSILPDALLKRTILRREESTSMSCSVTVLEALIFPPLRK